MSVRIYNYENEELTNERYEVKINGISVGLHPAKVSAYPINRRWPGHQRSIEQAEATDFLAFSMDEAVKISATPKFEFKTVKVRPFSANIKYIVEDGTVTLVLEKPQYCTIEFDNQHHTIHVFADPMPEYQVNKEDKDIIYFGRGFHDAGTIELKSNQTLFLDEGAVVYGCIHAIDAENIRILGTGILDNSKNKENILFEVDCGDGSQDVNNAKRQHTIVLEYCHNVLIDGITIRDSLVYNIRPICCIGVVIRNVKIIGCWRYNSDGIDMHNCQDVLIENCFIRTYDDSICVKGFDFYQDLKDMEHNGVIYDTFSDVVVKKCVIWNDWGRCLEIGAETRAEEIYNIRFEDCDLIHMIDSALDIFNVDWADIHDVIFDNIRIECEEGFYPWFIQTADDEEYPFKNEKKTDPMIFALCIEKHHEYSAGGERRGKIHDIMCSNISVFLKEEEEKHVRILARGYDEENKVENVTIKNIFINGESAIANNQIKMILENHVENIVFVLE